MSRFARRLAALGVALAMSTVVVGCTQLPFADNSYKEKIPAALEAADLGLTDIWADASLDGLTENLTVGATLGSQSEAGGSLLDDNPETEASDELVAKIIEISTSERTTPTRYFTLSLRDPDGALIDIVPALERLGASPLSGAGMSSERNRITTAEAEQIAEESAS